MYRSIILIVSTRNAPQKNTRESEKGRGSFFKDTRLIHTMHISSTLKNARSSWAKLIGGSRNQILLCLCKHLRDFTGSYLDFGYPDQQKDFKRTIGPKTLMVLQISGEPNVHGTMNKMCANLEHDRTRQKQTNTHTHKPGPRENWPTKKSWKSIIVLVWLFCSILGCRIVWGGPRKHIK